MKSANENNKPIAIEIINQSQIIAFTRPKERNPLSIETLEKLHDAVDKGNSNGEISKIIFTGTDDVFASGANLREIAELTSGTVKEFGLRGQSLMNKIDESPKLVIAAVNGFCFGGALDLALSCDVRIASKYAVFCHPGANLGIITGWGGTQRLPRLVGKANALEMFFTAKQLNANEALRINLIDEISENPLETALAYKADFETS